MFKARSLQPENSSHCVVFCSLMELYGDFYLISEAFLLFLLHTTKVNLTARPMVSTRCSKQLFLIQKARINLLHSTCLDFESYNKEVNV